VSAAFKTPITTKILKIPGFMDFVESPQLSKSSRRAQRWSESWVAGRSLDRARGHLLACFNGCDLGRMNGTLDDGGHCQIRNMRLRSWERQVP
jgi:hypothetical protein